MSGSPLNADRRGDNHRTRTDMENKKPADANRTSSSFLPADDSRPISMPLKTVLNPPYQTQQTPEGGQEVDKQTSMADSSDSPTDAIGNGTGKLVLAGDKLDNFTTSLKPLIPGLKSAALSFFDGGVILQGVFCGQRIFVPLPKEDCTEYEWCDIPAVFLCAGDSRKNLLDALRLDRKRVPNKATFSVTGTYPSRHVTQIVQYQHPADVACEQTVMMKYELWTSPIMFPCKSPDCTFSLSKQQIGKVLSVAGRADKEQLVFAVKPEGGLYVGTSKEVIHFEIDGSSMRDYPFSKVDKSTASIIQFLVKSNRRGQAVDGEETGNIAKGPDPGSDQHRKPIKCPPRAYNPKIVVGSGSGKPFCMALQDTASFRLMMQKVRTGADGADLSFYFSGDVKAMQVRFCLPSSPSAYVFCDPNCPQITELEETSAVAGHGGQSSDRKTNQAKKKLGELELPLKKRPSSTDKEQGPRAAKHGKDVNDRGKAGKRPEVSDRSASENSPVPEKKAKRPPTTNGTDSPLDIYMKYGTVTKKQTGGRAGTVKGKK